MTAPRTYRGFTVSPDFDRPLADYWTASHPDYEDPAYEDGRPLVLTGVDERECQIAIDDFLFDLGDRPRSTYEVNFGNPRKDSCIAYHIEAETAEAARDVAKGYARVEAPGLPLMSVRFVR